MRTRTIVVSAITALAVTCVAALGVVSGARAQDGADANKQNRREAFIARVAEKLGVEPLDLTQAVKDTALERVDEALAAGRITDVQAERMRARINDGKAPIFGVGAHRRNERRIDVRAALIDSAAGALGMRGDELRSELKAGKSVADVAEERGVPLGDVKQQILDEATSRVAQAVENGRMSQDRSDEMIAALAARLDKALQRSRPA